MRAKYAGTCSACGNRFAAGASIIATGNGYGHVRCPVTWYSRVKDLNDGNPLGRAAAIGAALELLQAEYDCDNTHGAYYISDTDVTRLAGYAAYQLKQQGGLDAEERTAAVTAQARVIRERRRQDKSDRVAA
jgi:hypothetical protein